jgi:hypothetical protein
MKDAIKLVLSAVGILAVIIFAIAHFGSEPSPAPSNQNEVPPAPADAPSVAPPSSELKTTSTNDSDFESLQT